MVQVTIVVPVIRPDLGRETFEAIMKHCNFPHIFKAIIHPNLTDLIEWSRNQGITVVEDLYIPIARAKKASVELCDTEYLLLFNSNVKPLNEMKPMLDLMESHPEIGVCAARIKKPLPRQRVGSLLKVKGGKIRETHLKERRRRGSFRLCDYVHDAATMYRTEIFKDVMFDTTYASGYAHLDFFMQLKETQWKVASSNEAFVENVEYTDPVWYHSIRSCGTLLSRERFQQKWGVTAW